MKKRILIFILVILLLICLGVFLAVWNGIIILNGYNVKEYHVRGVDVSAYQGDIDWQTLASQDITFAFIKATEGSTFVDRKFSYNFEEAKKTGLSVGAYHFFSYDSEGESQAENFIKNVVPFDGMLPPVIDLEFYGDKEKNPPDRADVDRELKAMLSILEDQYGQKPIIYATEKSYRLYLSGDYGDYDIWIRNVVTKPRLSDSREWTFWQFTNRMVLSGYNGEEKYIDVNVFEGKSEDYKTYLDKNGYKAAE